MAQTLRTERDGRVLTVLIDAPPHNFIGRRMARTGGLRPARRGMRAFVDGIASEGGSPWADAAALRPWQLVDVLDLGSPQ